MINVVKSANIEKENGYGDDLYRMYVHIVDGKIVTLKFSFVNNDPSLSTVKLFQHDLKKVIAEIESLINETKP